MAKLVEVHPDALDEAAAAVEWYAAHSQQAARSLHHRTGSGRRDHL